MAIEVYALESAILRADKMQNARRRSSRPSPPTSSQVFAADAADRLAHAAKNALAAIAGARCRRRHPDARKLLQQRPVDTIAARRRIADAIIEASDIRYDENRVHRVHRRCVGCIRCIGLINIDSLMSSSARRWCRHGAR